MARTWLALGIKSSGLGVAGSGGGGSGAPVGAPYVVVSTDGDLTAERVITAGSGISVTDGGAGGALTIAATGGGGLTALQAAALVSMGV